MLYNIFSIWLFSSYIIINSMVEKTLIVEGMTCNHCVNTVKRAISSLDGVSFVEVDLGSKKAKVSFDEKILNEDVIKKSIEEWGYKVSSIT